MKSLNAKIGLVTLLSALAAGNSFAVTIYSDDFSANQGWTLTHTWEIGSATASTGGVGGPDPSVDHTATADNGVLGADIGGNIGGNDGGLHPMWWATSPVINASSLTDANLSFYRWLTADYDPYMHSRIEGWDGNSWELIFTTGGPPIFNDASWTAQSYDVSSLAAGNSQFQVRFGWDVTSGGVYTISGWNVDDLTVSGTSSAAVPDAGTTASLLGLAMLGIAAVRRKLNLV